MKTQLNFCQLLKGILNVVGENEASFLYGKRIDMHIFFTILLVSQGGV